RPGAHHTGLGAPFGRALVTVLPPPAPCALSSGPFGPLQPSPRSRDQEPTGTPAARALRCPTAEPLPAPRLMKRPQRAGMRVTWNIDRETSSVTFAQTRCEAVQSCVAGLAPPSSS